MIKLVCPKCRTELKRREDSLVCLKCGFALGKTNGIYAVSNVDEVSVKEFYDGLYDKEKGSDWIKGLENEGILKNILEKISLSYRRERFFKNNIKGKNNLILDLACGAGRNYFKKYGGVIGIDLSLKPLRIAKEKYDLVILGSVDELPFPSRVFDYVVSSDFFGHIKNEDKDKIIREIYRVLKPGGKTLHVIETDSDNAWFKFAHKYPELFQKYFIEQIGGHIGLEMPRNVVERWKENDFKVIKTIKIWGVIWPVQDYQIFDNEYKYLSKLVRIIVIISKIFSKIKLIKVGVNILLNPINLSVESMTSLNNGQGLMIVCQKK